MIKIYLALLAFLPAGLFAFSLWDVSIAGALVGAVLLWIAFYLHWCHWTTKRRTDEDY